MLEPRAEPDGGILGRLEHHLVVIAQDEHHFAGRAECEQLVDDLAGARPAIDHIAQHHDGVEPGGLNELQQGVERVVAPVDVTNRESAARHGVSPFAATRYLSERWGRGSG